MNYDNPELRTLLAGQYALGHMSPRARARFERLLLSRPDYARELTAWEERLEPLALAVEPLVPRRRVWRGIQRRIRPESPARRSGRRGSGRFGMGGLVIAGMATAAFLAVLGLYLTRPAVPPAPTQYAVISTSKGVPHWVITVRDHRMHMRTVGRVSVPQGKSYQLWMLPGHGAKPVSLGLLPVSGHASEALSTEMLSALKSAHGLAVSIEPEGGSPTGLPTGPVVFTAPIASI
ncbi:MAG TPA: anti-sigma factor [Gammaproteobacteria bacterium]|nr:anti-sigma factor [Gammaproteobacteria bacterium]